MLVYKDGIVSDYRDLFPNVSFPVSGPTDDWFEEQGATKVNLFKPHDRSTQKLVSCDPYVEDGWAYTVDVVDKTQEELEADKQSKAAEVRKQRDDLLAQSDWRVIKAMELGGTLDPDWASYRQSLRDITAHPEFPEVTFPESPDSN